MVRGQAPRPVAGTAGSTSEDCLYLNVTTPMTTRRALPVLVYLHGGGLTSGAGSDLEPRRLAAREQVVVVTVNYRLGVFGFFGAPGLSGSGTFALQDQQATLAWVRRNVAAAVASWQPLSTVERSGSSVAAELGCPAAGLSCLRAVPAAPLLSDKAVAVVYWSPAYGTPVLPLRPAAAIAAGRFAHVPVVIGTTRDEGTLLVVLSGQGADRAAYRDVLARAFGDRADTVAAAYPAGTQPARGGRPSSATAGTCVRARAPHRCLPAGRAPTPTSSPTRPRR